MSDLATSTNSPTEARRLLAESDAHRSSDVLHSQALAEEAVHVATRDCDNHALATAKQRVAVCLLSRGLYDDCERWLDEADELSHLVDEPRLQFDMLLTRGVLQTNRGHLVSAVQSYTAALEVAAKVDDTLPTLGVINNLGGVYGGLRDFDAALACYRQVRDEAVATGQSHNLALALVNMGECFLELEQLEDARGSFELAIPHVNERDVYGLHPFLLHGLGDLASREGEHTDALDYLDEAVKLHREQDNRQGLLQALSIRGRVLEREGMLAEATEQHLEVLLLARDNHLPSEERRCCSELAKLYAAQEEWKEAYTYQTRRAELDAELMRLEKTGSIREITAKHEIEIHRLRNVELAEANASLRQAYDAIRVQQQELARARDAAETAARVKSEFLANMSHEIRTPLNAVVGSCSILQRTALTDRQRNMVSVIAAAGDLTVAIVDDILDLAKLEARGLKLARRPLQLPQLVDDVMGIVGARSEARRLQLSVFVAPDVPSWVIGDAQRLKQVILNLASNAVKFTEQGHVEVNVTRTRDEEVLRFEVSDTGLGVDPGEISKLFDPFVQGDNAENRRHGGTGLGLAICKRFVQLFDGEIGAEARPEGGSLFWFTARLPEMEGLPPEIPAPVGMPTNRGLGRALRVLVAEDVAANRMVIRAMLAHCGAHVDLVENGQKAVDAASVGRYDLVLMDCRMPVMDGYTAASEIIQCMQLEAPLIVALTANALPEQRARCIEVGMAEVLTKPLRLEVLQELLSRRFSMALSR